MPDVAIPVLTSVARRHPGRRIAVTGELLRLDGADLDAALREVWRRRRPRLSAPTSWTRTARIPRWRACRPARSPGLPSPAASTSPRRRRCGLPSGSGRSCRTGTPHATPRSSRRTGRRSPRNRSARRMPHGDRGGGDATRQLADEAFVGAARRLAGRPPRFRAELLAAVPAPVRARVAERWTAELTGRARAGRGPSSTRDRAAQRPGRGRAAAAETRRRRAVPGGVGAGRGRAVARCQQLDAHLTRSPELRAAARSPRGRREVSACIRSSCCC